MKFYINLRFDKSELLSYLLNDKQNISQFKVRLLYTMLIVNTLISVIVNITLISWRNMAASLLRRVLLFVQISIFYYIHNRKHFF